MSIEAMKRVVEAFDALPPDHPARYANLQINLLRTAIQQAEAQQPNNAACGSVQKRHQAQQPATGEPVAWMSPGKERLEFSREDTVYGSHTIPLYTHPAPLVPDDVVRDAERWRIANLTVETALKHPDHRTSEESVAFNAYRCAVENGLNFEAAIDAAMQAAKEGGA